MKAAGYKTRTRKAMKALGVYKEEFEPTITIYAQLQEERDTLQAEYKEGGYQFEVATASGKKKAPIDNAGIPAQGHSTTRMPLA